MIDNEQKKSIAICWIGIGNYNILFDEFYKSFKQNFCTNLNRTFFIFTDKPELYQNLDDCIVYEISNACTHKGFILFRKWKYLLMAEDRYLNYDYVAFVNGNMVCKEVVTENEVIVKNKPISIISHPGHIYTRKGTYNCNPLSQASFCPESDWLYKQAGFNVSTSPEFLRMANTIEGWRHLDKATGNDRYVPWHDETYANKYFYLNRDKLNVLEGRVYAFPGDWEDKKEMFDNCKIYTVNKRKMFQQNNVQFVASTSPDLYNISIFTT